MEYAPEIASSLASPVKIFWKKSLKDSNLEQLRKRPQTAPFGSQKELTRKFLKTFLAFTESLAMRYKRCKNLRQPL